MTRHKFAIPLLYVQGFVQGMAFSTIPGAANFLISPTGLKLTEAQYGTLFLPMIVGSILASLGAGALGKRYGMKQISLSSIFLNFLAMALFAACQFFIDRGALPFDLLLVGMLFLGFGFGANLTTLNTYIFHYFQKKEAAALTGLHCCLGIGAALGPLFFNYAWNIGLWWVDPLLLALIFLILGLLAFLTLPLRTQLPMPSKANAKKSLEFNPIFISFVIIALLYGICETMFGNWGTIYLHLGKKLSATVAASALSLFWAVLTLGRLLIVLLAVIFPPRIIYCCLAPCIAVGLIAIHYVNTPALSLLAFAIAGLGCSGFLPLTISLAQQRFPQKAQLVSGVLVAIYMAGYGIASEGVGLLLHGQVHLTVLFAWLLVPVIILWALTLLRVRN